MEKLSKALIKATDKQAAKEDTKKKLTSSALNTRGIFVGDDTGLLK